MYNDTKKVLGRCRPGSLILWHDFAPGLTDAYPFMKDVMRGVEFLNRDGLIRGNVLQLQDFFMGICRVPAEPARR